MYCRETENKIEQILKVFKEQLKADEWEYQGEISRLQRKSSTTYDISNLNDVLQIVKEVRKASEKWHASCEAMIRMVDMQCSTIDADKISHKSMTDIVGFMRYINEEANDINNSFDLQIDYGEKNDVGMIEFSATVEAMAIQKAWELKLSLHQESDEEKQVREEERKAQEEENRKAKKAQEKIIEKQKKQAQEVENIKKIIQECTENAEKNIDKKYIQLYANLQTQYESDIKKAKDEIRELEEQRNSLGLQRSNLGLFAFSAKKALALEIEEVNTKIADYRKKESGLPSEYEEKKRELELQKRKEKEDAIKKIKQENPIPMTPEERKAVEQKEKDEKLILDTLNKIGRGTVSEIQRANDTLADYSNQKVTSLLRGLVEEGRVCKYMEGRKVIFSAV